MILGPELKMEIKKENILLPLIFLVAFIFRLFFVLKIPFFSSDNAYFNLRHSEYIVSNYLPIVYDGLSYGGNIITSTHLFHYFLAAFDLVLNQTLVYKIIPALLASSLVFIVYILAKEITKNNDAALFSALLSAFIPAFIGETLNQISINSLYIPLFLLLIYAILNLRKRRVLFIICSLALVLLEPLNLLIAGTLIIFILLMVAESLLITKEDKEGVALYLILFVLVNLIFFKNLYFEQGIWAIWQNLPTAFYGKLFQDFSLLTTVGLIGVIPFVLGFTGFFIGVRKSKVMNLLFAIVLADFSLLLLKLIAFDFGVLILAIMFAITASISIRELLNYLNLTKLGKLVPLVMGVIVIASIASLLYTSTAVASEIITEISSEEILALEWFQENSSENSVVLAGVYEGYMINYIAERTNVIDTQFFNAENRVFDVNTAFTTESLVKAITVLQKYDVDYIYLSDSTREFYEIEGLSYVTDEECFELVFENDKVKIYQALC